MTDSINYIISLGGIFSHIIIALLLSILIFKKYNSFTDFVGRNGLLLSWAVALVGLVTSLYYSEVAGFEPCVLCWYQRIFLYPLVFILYVAIIRKNDKTIFPYAFTLSIIGTLLAVYHTYVQFFAVTPVTCSFSGGVPCNETYFVNFGYISIPVLSLTAFVLIDLFLIFFRRYAKNI